MIKTVNLRRLFRLVVFVAMLVALIWYVGLKRAEFLKGPVTRPTASTTPSATVTVDQTDYFTDARIDRERSRSQEIERLREIINSSQVDAATKREASSRFLALSKDTAREADIENLIKARGYDDCIAFSSNGSTVVVLKSSQVSQIDIGKISEIVAQITGGRPDTLRVLARQ